LTKKEKKGTSARSSSRRNSEGLRENEKRSSTVEGGGGKGGDGLASSVHTKSGQSTRPHEESERRGEVPKKKRLKNWKVGLSDSVLGVLFVKWWKGCASLTTTEPGSRWEPKEGKSSQDDKSGADQFSGGKLSTTFESKAKALKKVGGGSRGG